MDDFTEALDNNPRSTSALNYRAFISYRMGNFDDAIQDYNKSLVGPRERYGLLQQGYGTPRSGISPRPAPISMHVQPRKHECLQKLRRVWRG